MLRKYLSRKSVLWVLAVIVVVLAFYWLDNLKIQRSVQHSVSVSLTQSLQGEIQATPQIVTYTIPQKDHNAYMVINNSYRVLNVKDYWVQNQIENSARLLLSQGPTTPVCKLNSIAIDYVPAFENAGAFSTVQYVDPFGFVRTIQVNVSVPLRKLPLS